MTCRPALDEMSHYYTRFTLTTVLLAFCCLRVCDFSIHFPRFRFDRCSNFLFFHLSKGRRQIKQHYREKPEIFLLSSHLIRFFKNDSKYLPEWCYFQLVIAHLLSFCVVSRSFVSLKELIRIVEYTCIYSYESLTDVYLVFAFNSSN